MCSHKMKKNKEKVGVVGGAADVPRQQQPPTASRQFLAELKSETPLKRGAPYRNKDKNLLNNINF